jgi:hypothetical protein
VDRRGLQAHPLGLVEGGGITTCDVNEETTAIARRYAEEAGDHPTVEGSLRAFLDTDLHLYIEGGEGWIRYCSDGIRSERGAVLLQQILDAYPMEVYYNRIALGQIELNK